MGFFVDLAPLVEVLHQQVLAQRELVAELRQVRQILEPHSQNSGSFRAGERVDREAVDLSWLGETDEMMAVVREEMTKWLGRPLNDLDEAEIAERRARIDGRGASVDGFSRTQAEAEPADHQGGRNPGGNAVQQ